MMKAAQNTIKSTKSFAQSIAKQIAQEPAEILKDVKEQTIGAENLQRQPNQIAPQKENKEAEEQKRIADKLRSERQVEALNREIADIRKQDLFNDLQKRIAQGEEVPLEDYPELSLEQKQVLKAQMQAVTEQKITMQGQENNFTEPPAKKGRQLFNFGKKTAMKREQTHIEKPVPPSG